MKIKLDKANITMSISILLVCVILVSISFIQFKTVEQVNETDIENMRDEELREQIKGAGIGTSATRAEIIKKLEKIQYIQINDKTQIITPTQKGEIIYDIVYNAMPDMLNPKLTASWEKGLDMVSKKEIESNVFMEKLEKYIQTKFDKLIVKY